MTIEELTKAIARYVGRHSNRESIFLYDNPQWNINATELLDFISDTTGIDKEKIGEWVDEVSPRSDKGR